MGLFYWMLIFLGLVIVALAVVAALGRRLWRQGKALAHDLSVAGTTFSSLSNTSAFGSSSNRFPSAAGRRTTD